jgi:hypothetical protein
MRATPEELNVCRKGVKCIAHPGGVQCAIWFESNEASDEHSTPLGCGRASARFYRHCTRWGAAQGAAWSLDIFHELLEERISEVARFTHAGLAPSESKAEQFLKP